MISGIVVPISRRSKCRIRSLPGKPKNAFVVVKVRRLSPVLSKMRFSLWLNSNIELAEQLAEHCINSAQRRLRAAKTVVRKK